MKTSETFSARVFVGRREGYNGGTHQYHEAIYWVRMYCDEVGLGCNITDINFVYTGGQEPGVCVELIQYPRFPKSIQHIKNDAYSIAHLLMTMFKQERCSIVCTDKTYMLERETLE